MTAALSHLLLVEDSEDEAFLLYSELRARGFPSRYERVDTAVGLRQALASEWDLILCDHNMPGFDSVAALRIVKDSGKDIPFIIYSGQLSDQQAASALREGVHDTIEKGNYARLLPVIQRELQAAATRLAARQADHRIQELAFYDSVTGLPNHSLFCSRLTERILAAEYAAVLLSGAVFYLDLDRFMRINGSFGYDAGNAVLQQIAARLVAAMPVGSLVARLSGATFGLFVESDRAEQLEDVAQHIRACFDAPFAKGHLELFVTASIGVARLPADGREVYELLMHAETAMAEAKRRGGNQAQRYRRELNAHSGERLALEADLRHAIEREQLFVQFQPCVDARSRRTVGMEALLRWRHPRHGLVAPDRFIPIADEAGIIVELGEWVLREACRQGRRWQDQGFSIYIAVNVSAVQFGQPRLLEAVDRILAETGFAASALQLEITESVLMQDAESAIGMLRSLKNMGVKIAVDDFGTGYSSLAYLKRFPIDILKIDKSFVRDLPGDEEDSAIARAVIALAQSLHLMTVAEGVETPDQAEFLALACCDRFQGYHFARPLDPAALEARLLSER